MLTLEQYLEASSGPTGHSYPDDPPVHESLWDSLASRVERGSRPDRAANDERFPNTSPDETPGDGRPSVEAGRQGRLPRRFKLALVLVLVVALGFAAARIMQSRGLPSRGSPSFDSQAEGERPGAVGAGPRGTGGADLSEWKRSGGSTAPKSLGVHVAGAVAAPGVYYLDEGRRVVDALQAAGGATSEADLAKVNLAALLSDGDFVYIPKTGEEGSPPIGASPGQNAASGESKGTKVNVNKAPVSELEKLPGIGPTLAQRIVEVRASQGPFRSLADLRRVPGIGDAKIAQMAPNVVF